RRLFADPSSSSAASLTTTHGAAAALADTTAGAAAGSSRFSFSSVLFLVLLGALFGCIAYLYIRITKIEVELRKMKNDQLKIATEAADEVMFREENVMHLQHEMIRLNRIKGLRNLQQQQQQRMVHFADPPVTGVCNIPSSSSSSCAASVAEQHQPEEANETEEEPVQRPPSFMEQIANGLLEMTGATSAVLRMTTTSSTGSSSSCGAASLASSSVSIEEITDEDDV